MQYRYIVVTSSLRIPSLRIPLVCETFKRDREIRSISSGTRNYRCFHSLEILLREM